MKLSNYMGQEVAESRVNANCSSFHQLNVCKSHRTISIQMLLLDLTKSLRDTLWQHRLQMTVAWMKSIDLKASQPSKPFRTINLSTKSSPTQRSPRPSLC